MLAWLVVAAALPAQPVTTYNRDVAPLIYARCAECHRPDGNAPFSLLTFQDVRKRATRIVEVTQQRYMPPWKPEPEASAAFADSRRLSNEELAVIARWARDGFTEGDSNELPAPPRWDSEWRLGKPDLVVRYPSRIPCRRTARMCFARSSSRSPVTVCGTCGRSSFGPDRRASYTTPTSRLTARTLRAVWMRATPVPATTEPAAGAPAFPMATSSGGPQGNPLEARSPVQRGGSLREPTLCSNCT